MALDPFFGSVLGAAGNLIGGAIGGESSRKANENARDQAAHQMQQQKDFAQHGIKWRADDVMGAYAKTGIHPLALLGVQGPTYSPVTSVFNTSPMGDAIGRAGQDISRGIHATADNALRGEALKMQGIALKNATERGALENTLLRMQIAAGQAKLHQVGSAPPVPNPNVTVDPLSIVSNSFDTTRIGPTASQNIQSRRFVDTPPGGQIPVMSKEHQESTEDAWLDKLAFFLSERLFPQLGINKYPPQSATPGNRWAYDIFKGYYQVPKRSHGYVYPGKPWLSIPSGTP